MVNRRGTESAVEYGIRLEGSSTVLMVTDDVGEAQQTLDMVGHGVLLRRTVWRSPWTTAETNDGFTG